MEATTLTTLTDLDRLFEPVLGRAWCAPGGLPDRFDDVDLAILDWITAEGRRIGRNIARI